MSTTKVELGDPLSLRQGISIQEQLILNMYHAIIGTASSPHREDVTAKGVYPIFVGTDAFGSFASHEFIYESVGDGGFLRVRRLEKGSRRKTHEIVDNEGNRVTRRGAQRFPIGGGEREFPLLGITRRAGVKKSELTAAIMYFLPLSDPRRYGR